MNMPEALRSTLAVGAWVWLEKPALQEVIDALRQAGYRTVGPRVADGAIVYDDLDSVSQLPIGVLDEQDGGRYRLTPSECAGYFDYVVGPHSLKSYVFPPRETIQELERRPEGWHMRQSVEAGPPVAVIGVRSCDLHALQVQDRVFLQGPYVDPAYQARRERLFLVAVNCRRAAATCFCHSMQTGPGVECNTHESTTNLAAPSFDLALTELDDRFTVTIGSARGANAMTTVPCTPCSADDIARARDVPRRLQREMEARRVAAAAPELPRPRSMDTTGIRDLLLNNLNHARWNDVAQRCLSCTNCTLVCPTCFCSNVEEVADLTGDHVERQRTWASCFMMEHSQLSSGVVRNSTAARYRQWLTHKLAGWIDQYGVSGCVGCGRCITWCPVGIDLTEEVAAIRGGAAC